MSSSAENSRAAKPLFIDNRDGNTLARAITTHLATLREEGKTPAELCVASCYFNPQGLELIAGETRHVPRIRLLLGADPAPEATAPRRTPYDPTEPEFTRQRVRQGLEQLEHGLRRERDLLPFDLEEDHAIRRLLDLLHSGRIEVRRYEAHFLHAKAWGTEGAAQTGEEYRQELRRALERYGDGIRNLPWRSGSGMRKGERAGHLFCATVGERIYLRFVSLEAQSEIVGELGTCLRLLECTEETPRLLSDDMAHTAYAAWARARRSILDAWTFEADPANLQPRIRKLNRDVAAFLRANPPAGIEQDRLHRCLDAVESP